MPKKYWFLFSRAAGSERTQERRAQLKLNGQKAILLQSLRLPTPPRRPFRPTFQATKNTQSSHSSDFFVTSSTKFKGVVYSNFGPNNAATLILLITKYENFARYTFSPNTFLYITYTPVRDLSNSVPYFKVHKYKSTTPTCFYSYVRVHTYPSCEPQTKPISAELMETNDRIPRVRCHSEGWGWGTYFDDKRL